MICSKDKCTGCFACANICPKKCITFEENKIGDIYPKINDSECIHCELCVKTCPVNYPVKKIENRKAFAAWAKKEEERKTSTSGGLASVLSNFILVDGGIVYGSTIEKEGSKFKVVHRSIDSVNELHKLKGSKYVHSHILDNFCSAREHLKKGLKVLFVGTPCQIAGLKSFLKVDYENLYTIDIICHGVPSQKLLNAELQSLGFDGSDINRFTFREDKGFYLSLYKNDELCLEIPYFKSLYYTAFLDALCYRESCYSCPYATNKRVGDITLGDFWGLGDLEKAKKEEKKGISLVLINSEKGENLFNRIENEIQFEERSVEEGIKGNSQLRHPSPKNKGRFIFLEEYEEKGNYNYAIEKALNYNSFSNKLKRFILNNKTLVNLINTIKKRKVQDR